MDTAFEKKCPECGKWYLSANRSQVCCTRECSKKHFKKRRKIDASDVKKLQHEKAKERSAQEQREYRRKLALVRNDRELRQGGYRQTVTHRTVTGECGRKWKVEERR